MLGIFKKKTVNVGDIFVFAGKDTNPFDRIEYEIVDIKNGWAKYWAYNNQYYDNGWHASEKVSTFKWYYTKIKDGNEND